MGELIHILATMTFLLIAFTCLIDTMTNCDNGWNKEDTICVVSLALSFFLAIFLFIGSSNVDKEEWRISENPYQTDYIASLNDDSKINGSFYLRRGYIEEYMYYQYMILQSDGGYSYGKARADISTVYVSDDNFRVEWYTKERNWLWFEEEETFCKIYVPNGSITEEYDIDLK